MVLWEGLTPRSQKSELITAATHSAVSYKRKRVSEDVSDENDPRSFKRVEVENEAHSPPRPLQLSVAKHATVETPDNISSAPPNSSFQNDQRVGDRLLSALAPIENVVRIIDGCESSPEAKSTVPKPQQRTPGGYFVGQMYVNPIARHREVRLPLRVWSSVIRMDALKDAFGIFILCKSERESVYPEEPQPCVHLRVIKLALEEKLPVSRAVSILKGRTFDPETLNGSSADGEAHANVKETLRDRYLSFDDSVVQRFDYDIAVTFLRDIGIIVPREQRREHLAMDPRGEDGTVQVQGSGVSDTNDDDADDKTYEPSEDDSDDIDTSADESRGAAVHTDDTREALYARGRGSPNFARLEALIMEDEQKKWEVASLAVGRLAEWRNPQLGARHPVEPLLLGTPVREHLPPTATGKLSRAEKWLSWMPKEPAHERLERAFREIVTTVKRMGNQAGRDPPPPPGYTITRDKRDAPYGDTELLALGRRHPYVRSPLAASD